MRSITNEELAWVSGGTETEVPDTNADEEAPGVDQVVIIKGEKMGFFEKIWYDLTTPKPSALEAAMEASYNANAQNPECQTSVSVAVNGAQDQVAVNISTQPGVTITHTNQEPTTTYTVQCKP